MPINEEPDSWSIVAILTRSRSLRTRRAAVIETPWNDTKAITPATCRNFHQEYAARLSIRS